MKVMIARIISSVALMLVTVLSMAANDDEIGGSIHGKVTTADGKPAKDVTVTIKGTNRTTLTDEQGVFLFKHIVPGNYEIEISLVGYETVHQSIVIENNKTTSLSFQLKLSQKQLQEVIVTTTEKRLGIGKLSIADKDLPLITGIVSNKVITDQQAIRVGDIVKNVPGVTLLQTRFGVNETYGARGYIIGVTGGAGGGSIFKNGLPTNIAGMPEAVSLESVEIIKGSSAFLYGSSSGGLIVNMVTKKPKYNFGGEVSMMTGSNQQYKPVVDVYGPLTEKLAFRIIGSYENDRSYRDVVKTERTYINPSLLYKFNNKTSLLIQGDYLKAHITPDGGIGLLDSGRVLTNAIPRSRFQNVSWAYNDVAQHSVSAELKHVFNDRFSFNLATSYQNTDVDSYGAGNLNTASTTGTIARPLARAHSKEKDFAAQLNVEGKFNTGRISHHFVAGADFTRVVTETDAFNILTASNSILKTYDTINLLDPTKYRQRTDIPNAVRVTTITAPSNRTGIYFQDLIVLTSKFKLFAGIRYSYQSTVQTSIDSAATATRPASTTLGSTPTTNYNVLSPKAGLIFQPTAGTSIFISYANSFTTNTGVDVYGNLLSASIINQYEAGVKKYLLDGKLNANISIYRIINSNLAQQAQYKADGVTTNNDANIKALVGETTSDGIEIGVNGTISKSLYFLTGYSYNHIRFTHTTNSKGSNVDGETLVNAPRSTANASIFYTVPSGHLKGIKIGASGFYMGSRFGGYNNTVGQAILGSRMIALSGFTTINFSAGYTYKKASFMCKLSNVFNALNYLVHDNYSITPIAPRQIALTLAYKF